MSFSLLESKNITLINKFYNTQKELIINLIKLINKIDSNIYCKLQFDEHSLLYVIS